VAPSWLHSTDHTIHCSPLLCTLPYEMIISCFAKSASFLLYYTFCTIMKMDEAGSFHIKNIGKCPVFVNTPCVIPSYKCINLSSDLLIEVPILPVPLISNWNLYTFLSHSSLWLIFCVSPCFLNVLTGQPWFVLAYLQSYYNERQITCPVPKKIYSNLNFWIHLRLGD
jgi:hypothetical protein